MNDFENELDSIRMKLYEKTKDLSAEALIQSVNDHAHAVAKEFGIMMATHTREPRQSTHANR